MMLFITVLIVFIFSIFMMFRNFAVYNYFIMLADKVHELNIRDLRSGEVNPAILNNRWDGLNQVSYNQMMLEFWRPLESFHDEDFLRELGVVD